jgi:hypothetical protein
MKVHRCMYSDLKATNTNFIVIGLIRPGLVVWFDQTSNPRSNALRASMLTNTPLIQFQHLWLSYGDAHIMSTQIFLMELFPFFTHWKCTIQNRQLFVYNVTDRKIIGEEICFCVKKLLSMMHYLHFKHLIWNDRSVIKYRENTQ